MRRLVGFLADVLISGAVSVALPTIIWGLVVSLGPLGIVFLLTPLQAMLWMLIYGPFVALPLYGLIRFRPGFVVGPVILGLAAYVYSTTALKKADAEIAALIPPAAEPVRTDYAIIATDGSNDWCDATCIRGLATSPHAFARLSEHVKDHRWRVYSVATGETCLTQENATLALEFLQQGYPGKCAVLETVADFGEGLILRTRTVDRYRPASDLPKGFAGAGYELSERRAGHTTLLARRITGVMAPPLPEPLMMIFGKKQERFDIGPRIDEKQFLATALKIPIDDLIKRAQPFPFDEVLDEIEKYFGRKEIVNRAQMRSIEGVAENAWRQVVLYERRAHIDELQRRIKRLLAGDDPIRVTAAVHGLSALDGEQQAFADERVLELAFVAMSPDTMSAIRALLEQRIRGGLSIPDALRERARSRLNDPDVTAAHRQVLVLIAGP